MSKKIYGVAVHGAGWVSGEHIKAFKNNPNTKVVVISSRKLSSCEARAKEAGLTDVKFYTDYDKVVDDPDVDIISICTPQHLHPEETVKAAEVGKHIVIEKPVANDLEGLKSMRDAVRKAKVKTVVSFHLRWNPIFKTIKHITPEALGDIYYLEVDYNSHISDWWSGWGWGKRKDIGVSSFLVAGVHAVDALRWFAGKGEFKTANITEVMSYSGGYRNKLNSKDPEYVGYPGFEIMLLKLDTGAIGKVSCNYDCIQPYTFPWKIYGNKGTIRDNQVWSKMFPGQNDWVKVPSILPDTPDVAHHPFQGEMDHFVECILNDRESHCNLEDVVNTHEAALAAIQSSENGNIKIKLPLIK